MKKACQNHFAHIVLSGIGQTLCILTLVTMLAISGWIWTPWTAAAAELPMVEPSLARHTSMLPTADQYMGAIPGSTDAILQQIVMEQSNASPYVDRWTIDELPVLYDNNQYLASLARRHLELLHTLDTAAMTPEQLILYKTLEPVLRNTAEVDAYTPYRYLATHTDMTMIYLPYIFLEWQAWEIMTLDDAERVLKRIQQFSQLFHQMKTQLKIREKLHIIPPAFVLDRLHDATMSFLDYIHMDTIYQAFEMCVEYQLRRLDDATKQKLCAKARELTTAGRFEEAYTELAQYFLDLKDKTDIVAGVWQLPHGDASYAHMLQTHTSTNLTPEEIHNLGLREVAEIQAEIRVLLDEMGYQGIGLREALQMLDEQTRITGDDLILQTYQGYMDEAQAQLGSLFEKVPVNFKVPIRLTREGTYPAYLSGRTFYVDVSFPQSTYSMRTTTYHEAIPGHALQGEYARQFRTGTMNNIFQISAYQEGWALYAERLAYESGMLKEAESIIGYLQYRLFRAARLVIDTGIHYKRWTREEAIQYFTETTGLAKFAESEVERYISWPGQACTYLIGELKFMELRDKAKAALGDKFDLKKFHHAILTYGIISLDALEAAVNHYIATNQ